MGKIRVNFDGACWNKEGHRHLMGVGVAVFIDDIYEEDLSRSFGFIDLENGSNNVAEWLGCVEAAKIVKDLRKVYPHYSYVVCSDSQIITNQFNDKYALNKDIFKRYKKEAKALNSIREVTWIPREENKEADKLSKEGLESIKPTNND